ncbi:MAG: hypothetical protein FWD53_11745, partial [Phycisphaerales bacterium]|nr:hypothetical protein [Phycisphaerales bacterium]
MTTTTILLTAGLTAALLMTACTQNYGDYFSLRPGLANSSVGIVSNINITSNHVPDISDLDAWKKSYIRPDMTDHEKALACWKTLVAFQHQNPPPSEFLHSPENSALLDPFKMFHVYGYGLCSVHSAHLIAMARTVGLTARGQTVVRHVIPEIFYDNAWHMFDSSLVNYFPKPDGSIASIDEIIAATAEFYKKHPELKGNGKGLDQFRQDGRWKTEGPPLFAANPFYDENGMLDANWPWPCGWMESMHEYDGTTQFIYESGYSMGYRLNIQLRPGEKITRNWHHKGMHINMDNPNPKTRPTCLDLVPGEGPMKFLHKYGNVLAPGRIGNGVHEYNVPLKNIARSALHTENLTNVGNTLQAQDPSKPAILIIRMPSSYVYLAGELNLDVTITPPATV